MTTPIASTRTPHSTTFLFKLATELFANSFTNPGSPRSLLPTWIPVYRALSHIILLIMLYWTGVCRVVERQSTWCWQEFCRLRHVYRGIFTESPDHELRQKYSFKLRRITLTRWYFLSYTFYIWYYTVCSICDMSWKSWGRAGTSTTAGSMMCFQSFPVSAHSSPFNCFIAAS